MEKKKIYIVHVLLILQNCIPLEKLSGALVSDIYSKFAYCDQNGQSKMYTSCEMMHCSVGLSNVTGLTQA